jgi:predicted ATPase/class 3 adenylate cyclase
LRVRQDLPTGTVTFVFTDVEGSTRLLDELGDEAYAQSLAEHRLIVREACAAEGGVEVDTQGDAFFLAFASVPGAVSAARAMTRALGDGPIRLRIGLHTGTPVVTEEGYAGRDVHLAARIAASGHGGQVVLSQATRALLDGDSLTDLGEHRLKDIEEAVAIFQLGSESFPPLKTISNTNLPRPASSFVGRTKELADVLSVLEQGARLVTLTGPGGSGKTRLALEAATTLVPSYKAGVFWVGLSALRDASLVSQTIRQTLGSKNGLAEHIGERELLLLLDNLEQVIEAAPELGELLQACPNLDFIVTSRELLRVSGEVEYPVPPLAQPEAVSLFCERSRLESSEEMAELCTRLDNLPLAVELAAARTKALTVSQIAERLSQRLDLLKGGRDADPRQQTLRATIEWSHDLLSAEEQELFARLSVFAGGSTLEAAEVVADAELDTLQSLVEKSLVRFSNERFWMLETVRTYARERLVRSGEEAQLRRRHALATLAFVEATYRRALEGGDQAVLYAGIDVEQDNVRAALEWARDSYEDETLLRLTAALPHWWGSRGLWDEEDTWLAVALDRAPSSPAPAARMSVLRAASTRAAVLRDFPRSEALVAEWLQLAEVEADEDQILMAMNSAAYNALDQGDVEGARSQFAAIGKRASEMGNREMMAFAAVNLGEVAWRSREFRTSLEYSANAAELFRELGDDGGVWTAIDTCGWAAIALSDPLRGERFLGEALRIAGRLRARRPAAQSACGLGAALIGLGEAERGTQLVGAAGFLLEELDAALADAIQEELRERAIAEGRAALGADAFAAAWARGEAMALDEMVELASSTEGLGTPGASRRPSD